MADAVADQAELYRQRGSIDAYVALKSVAARLVDLHRQATEGSYR
jgi:hypothetical protein